MGLSQRISGGTPVAIMASVGALASPAHGQFATNLVTNPSFEAFMMDAGGAVEAPSGTPVSLLGWSATPTLHLETYGGPLMPTTPPPPVSGTFWLAGGSPSTSVSQLIDISFASPAIDAGRASFELSGWLGSFTAVPVNTVESDIATLSVEFFDDASSGLGVFSIVGPDIPTDVGAPLLAGVFSGFFELAGPVPLGAREAVVTVEFERDDSAPPPAFNHANADNIALRIFAGAPFGDPFSVPAQSEPVALAVGAIDDTGLRGVSYPDLVIADRGADSVIVATNLGVLAGDWQGFDPSTDSYTVGDAPNSVALTDWNGDDFLDIIVGHDGSAFLAVLLNDGAGEFMSGGTLPTSAPVAGVAQIDNDDDKDLDDIAATIPSSGIVITIPGGGGATQSWPVGMGPESIVSADFDLDLIADILVANRVGGDLSLLRGLGLGAYAAETRYPAGVLGGTDDPASLSASDIDGDGWIDVAIANEADDSVTILFNLADDLAGDWLGFAPPQVIEVGASPKGVSLGAFSDLGTRDVVTADSADDTVSYARYAGAGFAPAVQIEVAQQPISISVADLDEDGLEDVLNGSVDPGGMGSLSRGAGPRVEARLSFLPALQPDAPCPGDVDGDDLVGFSDLNAVLATFGDAGKGLPADLDGDGVVGFSDLNELLSAFGDDCVS